MTDTSLGSYSVPNLVCDTHASAASSKDNHAEIRQLLVAHMQARHYGRQSDTAGALDIVVEAGELRAVSIKDASC